MARSNASSRRALIRQRRNQFGGRGVLSNRTLLLGSVLREIRSETRRSKGGDQITREEIRELPTSEKLQELRREEQRIKKILAQEQQRIDDLKSSHASTSKLRFLKRYDLEDDISRAKRTIYDTRFRETDVKSERKKLEELMKKTHRIKLKAMRKSRGPNLP